MRYGIVQSSVYKKVCADVLSKDGKEKLQIEIADKDVQVTVGASRIVVRRSEFEQSLAMLWSMAGREDANN